MNFSTGNVRVYAHASVCCDDLAEGIDQKIATACLLQPQACPFFSQERQAL
jgi:hypothetical protein